MKKTFTLFASLFLLNINVSATEPVVGRPEASLISVEDVITSEKLSAKIAFSDAWIRLPTPTSQNTAAYFKLHNNTNIDLKVISAAFQTGATKAEIHGVRTDDNGVMKMYPLDSVTVPAGQVAEFKPNSNHIMLMNLTKKLEEGQEYDVKLKIVPADQIKYPNIEVNYLLSKIPVKAFQE